MDGLRQTKTACLLFLTMTILTGLIYPYTVTIIGQIGFPWQANGSLITHQKRIIGSLLIGQPFSAPNYFWGRPSATLPFPNNPLASQGSNLAPSNPQLLTIFQKRLQHLQETDPKHQNWVPLDLITASGSGLDPEISPLAAVYQIPRIAANRNISPTMLASLIQQQTQARWLGIWGEPRVNVLYLNLQLDQLTIEKFKHE